MAEFVFSNFFATTLSAPVTTSQTTISVASATGAPTVGAGDQWGLIIQSANTPSIREIVYVTATSGSTFTVSRAQEGTTALTWSVGDNVFAGNTAGQMAAFLQSGGGFPSLLSSNGYKKIPDTNSPAGYWIFQWGAQSATSIEAAVTFPVPFPNACLRAAVAAEAAATDSNWGAGAPTLGAVKNGSISTTGFTFYGLVWNLSPSGWVGASGSSICTMNWYAIGY